MIAIVTKKLFDRLLRKPYREAYVEENVRTGIAYQIRALREQRGWSQKKLAQVLGKPQSVLSRIEDPDYGKLSVQTLLEVAAALDVALLVQFAGFPEFIERMQDVSPSALNRDSFSANQFQAFDVASSTVAALRQLQTQVASPNGVVSYMPGNMANVTFADFVLPYPGTRPHAVYGTFVGGSVLTAITASQVAGVRHTTDPQGVAGRISPEPAKPPALPLAPTAPPAWLQNLTGATVQ